MAWSSKTQIITSQSVSTSEVFSSAITLGPGESAHIEVEADFPATPTDDLQVNLYGTLDDSTENWDDTPKRILIIDNGTDPNKVSFGIDSFGPEALYKCRIGVKRTGSTDTITVDAWYRKNGISL